MYKLSVNFTLEEMIATNTGLPNNPNKTEQDKLLYLCQYIWQPTRDKWGPIRITSGFRAFNVNMSVGGSLTSQHKYGEAGDGQPLKAPLQAVFDWMRKELNYGQLIIYPDRNFIHASLSRIGKDKEAMECINGKYKLLKGE